MKTFITLAFASLLAATLYGQTPTQEELAKRIVSSTLNIQPGETVIIEGSKEQIPLMESIAVEVTKKGAVPLLTFLSPKVLKASFRDIPESEFAAYLKGTNKLYNQIDATILVYDYTLDIGDMMIGIPAEYSAKWSQASNEADKSRNQQGKQLQLNIPTRKKAEEVSVDFETYQQMQLAAMNTDYSSITAKAKQLDVLLQSGKSVKITNANGTNLTFSLALRPSTIDDGVISSEDLKSPVSTNRQVSLPAGSIFVTADETSANGKMVVSSFVCASSKGGDVKVRNLSFDVVKGQVLRLKAETNGGCVEAWQKQYPETTQFGGFQIGLNPALKGISERKQDYQPDIAEGMVGVYFGMNESSGGKNKGVVGNLIKLEKATVEIDGKTVVKEGKLILSATAK